MPTPPSLQQTRRRKGGNVSLGVDSFDGKTSASNAPNVIIKSGATIDISGGWVTYQAGQVASSLLVDSFGRIVNIASTAALKGYPYVSAYVASKHALLGLTRSLALETAKTGVTVNAVCPGFTDTDMVTRAVATIAAAGKRSQQEARDKLVEGNPAGRLVRPEEVADVVAFLCRTDASAMTGQAIAVACGEV